MKRQKAISPAKGKPQLCSDGSFAAKFPTITTWMTDGFWDDGKAREVSTLGVRFGDGQVHLSLVDHDAKRSVYTDAKTIEDALMLLEEALKAETCVWRAWKAFKK